MRVIDADCEKDAEDVLDSDAVVVGLLVIVELGLAVEDWVLVAVIVVLIEGDPVGLLDTVDVSVALEGVTSPLTVWCAETVSSSVRVRVGEVEIVAVAERVPVGDIDTRGVKDRAPGREIVALREAVSSAVALAERVARVRVSWEERVVDSVMIAVFVALAVRERESGTVADAESSLVA